MANIYVKPSPGGRIRMPERNMMPMPEEGAFVPRNDFYERLLIGRDVIECDPPVRVEPVEPVEPAEPAEPAEEAAGTEQPE